MPQMSNYCLLPWLLAAAAVHSQHQKKNCGEISRTHTPLKSNLSFSPKQDIKKPQHHHHHPAKVCNQNSRTKKQKL